MVKKCGLCDKSAHNMCAKCGTVYYCSREHQKDDWKKHKSYCKPVEIKENEILGRHLVAKKDIEEGTMIYKEKPLIIGPSQVTLPVCLGCLKVVTEKDSNPCDRCGWPVCDDHCQESPHHKPECEFTVARGQKVHIQTFEIPHPNYQCITVLRCLYQKRANPEIWKKLEALESHCEKRKGTEKWENDHSQIVQFVRRFFKLEEEFNENDIMKICGVVQINGHEIPLQEPPFVAIYDTTSMIEHNCRSNCTKSFTDKGEVVIAAAEKISKGSNLSICYTDPLWGTVNRRHYLYETKFFHCKCERCSDVTENGTMFSALKCTKEHCSGHMLPRSFIPETGKNGEDEEIGVWKCDKCENSVTDHYAQKLVEHIGRDLMAMEKGSCNSCMRFLGHYGKMLHKNHFYMTDVNLALAQLIGQEEENGLASVSDTRLAMKLDLTRKIIELLDNLVPAVTRVRGLLMFELHAALAETGRRQTSRVAEGPCDLIDALTESKKALQKSIDLLKYEPLILPEGKIRKQAEKNLLDLEGMLTNLCVIANQKII